MRQKFCLIFFLRKEKKIRRNYNNAKKKSIEISMELVGNEKRVNNACVLK